MSPTAEVTQDVDDRPSPPRASRVLAAGKDGHDVLCLFNLLRFAAVRGFLMASGGPHNRSGPSVAGHRYSSQPLQQCTVDEIANLQG